MHDWTRQEKTQFLLNSKVKSVLQTVYRTGVFLQKKHGKTGFFCMSEMQRQRKSVWERCNIEERFNVSVAKLAKYFICLMNMETSWFKTKFSFSKSSNRNILFVLQPLFKVIKLNLLFTSSHCNNTLVITVFLYFCIWQ